MDILSLTEALELGLEIRIKSGILRISGNIHIERSKEQRLKFLEDIGRLEIQPIFMISKVKTCNANVAKGIRKPTLLVDFLAFPYERGCHPHAWFNIELSEKNPKRWRAPAKGAFMDLFRMINVRCPPSKASEYIGKLKKNIYTAEYHPDFDKKDKIVNSSILLADISYEQIIRALELRNIHEKSEKILRNSLEITTNKSSETHAPEKQVIHGMREGEGTREDYYENKYTRDNEMRDTCSTYNLKPEIDTWLDDYGK